MKKTQKIPPRQQITSQELIDDLLAFIRTKFYPEHPVQFIKDRSRLLQWVVLYPAGWLNGRGVTLPPARYKAILVTVLMDALRFGQQTKMTYLPAYLRQVVQSHFRIRGEDYYDEAKSARNLAEHIILVAGQARGTAAPDPIQELAAAARLLKARKPAKLAPAKPASDQLKLL